MTAPAPVLTEPAVVLDRLRRRGVLGRIMPADHVAWDAALALGVSVSMARAIVDDLERAGLLQRLRSGQAEYWERT